MAEFINVRKQKEYRERTDNIPDDYLKLYRFKKESVRWLAQHFLGDSEETRGGALSQTKRMELFLRFLSDPGFQMRISKEEGIYRTTVCKTIKIVLYKIIDKAHLWIKFPSTVDDIKLDQEKWSLRFNFPCAIGAIDCTHVEIQKPSNHGDEYVNRKGFCSINVQATCNAHEEFTSIDCNWPGSVHDSRILKRSRIFHFMNNQRSDAILLGDIGYGIRPWLLTPYKNPTQPEQLTYNKIHTKNRVIIERCFGQLKRRFPILGYKVRLSTDKVPAVIVSCAVLHNIAKFLKDDYEYPDPQEQDDEAEEDISDSEPVDNSKELGQSRRNEISQVLHSLYGI